MVINQIPRSKITNMPMNNEGHSNDIMIRYQKREELLWHPGVIVIAHQNMPLKGYVFFWKKGCINPKSNTIITCIATFNQCYKNKILKWELSKYILVTLLSEEFWIYIHYVYWKLDQNMYRLTDLYNFLNVLGSLLVTTGLVSDILLQSLLLL